MFTLEELKKMGKDEIINIPMYEMPLSEKSIKHFLKLKKKNDELKAYNCEYDKPETLLSFLYADSLVFSSTRGKEIKLLMDTLGLVRNDIFSYEILKGKSKEDIMQMTLHDLCFPTPVPIKYTYTPSQFSELFQISEIDYCGYEKLADVLKVGFRTFNEEECGPENVREPNWLGPVKAIAIKDHILKLGFEMGEHPFLNQEYWDWQASLVEYRAELKQKRG